MASLDQKKLFVFSTTNETNKNNNLIKCKHNIIYMLLITIDAPDLLSKLSLAFSSFYSRNLIT